MVPGFLLDANLSPRTARHLRQTLGLDAVSILERTGEALKDSEVAAIARREGRVVITFDEDFTRRFGHVPAGVPGVIHLRLSKSYQFVPEVNNILERFFQTQAQSIDLAHALVTITERTIVIEHWSS